MSSEPHRASDEMTTAAVQARVWDDLTACARAALDLASKDRSIYSLDRLDSWVSAMRHQIEATRRA